MNDRILLAIAGSIGSGKTTLTRRLAERLELHALYESTEQNPYLEDFYHDMPRYALSLQLRFLSVRVAQLRASERLSQSAIQDRTCYEDAEIFARNLHDRGDMPARDWATYALIAEQLLDGVAPPTLLVYLRRSPAGCLAQIRKRGRGYEQDMPMRYLEDLGARYDAWFDRYERGPKMRVAAEEYDFLGSEADLGSLLRRIEEALPQRRLPFA